MTSPTNCPCDEPKDTEAEIARALNSIAAGQTALARQVRSFPAVREALLDSLPDATTFDESGFELRPLADWRARNSRDLGLMLLEMWAYVSDVLSFYDERIANESYIRTAQRAVSLRRLVELLGYIPAPGIAGSVTLAALAEGRKAVSLPVGTAFRSDAFGDQPPQVFEITAPTNIHPFKNEWTLGPIPQTILPQPTPTQVEEQASGITPTGGEYLVFETLEFGLAVDRFALITVAGLPTATQVMGIKSFSGKDGRTYAEVRFNPHVRFPGPGPGADVKVPTVTAVVTRFQRTLENAETEPRPPVEPGPESGQFTVYLDSVYRQLRPSDSILIVGFEEPQAATVVRASESSVIVQTAEESASDKDVTIPVTRIVIEGTTPDALAMPTGQSEQNALTFHFSMVNGGRVTAVGETELTPQQLTNSLLPVTGNVERPPGVNTTAPLTQQFLLTDPDGNGAEIAGRMFFGSSGRAQLAIDENPSASPPPLPASLYKTPLSVFGNVITATRGETVHNEVLGSGDPRIAGQSFTLKKKPLTYVDAPNELGRESSLQLFVDGVRWREVRSFFNCGPENRVYIVRHDAEQNAIITFGDGVRGARAPSGVGNVRATYRFGAGEKAPPAGAISQLARPVIGLRGVRSPIAAVPGRDPDSAETLRTDAPVSARLLGRAVSPQDFEALASLERGVVRATADFHWDEFTQQAGVTITYIGERDPDELRIKLAGFAEVGLLIIVKRASPATPFLTLTVAGDPNFEVEALKAAILAELLDTVSGPLALANTPIGGQLLLSPLYELLHRVPGVVYVEDVVLGWFVDDGSSHSYPSFVSGTDLVCIPKEVYLDFTKPDAIAVNVIEPSGPVAASREGGC